MITTRDNGIEILKAFAALLVVNSHMEAMYADYGYLATGGAIGDALFFFCSGYTLFFGRGGSFMNWYKRRISRIYPTVLVISLLYATYQIDQIQYRVIANLGSGWFVACIFLYYALLYPVRKYCSNYLWHVFGTMSCVVVLLLFLFGIEEKSAGNIYGTTYYKWSFFFLFMILGSICGKYTLARKDSSDSFIRHLVGTIVSVLTFYAIFVMTKKPGSEKYQLLSLIPLLSICFCMWSLCKSEAFKCWCKRLHVERILLFIGGLCLEMYLAQGLVFTTKYNYMFPLNIPVIVLILIGVAYVVRCISRFLLQTFQKEDYDWKAIIRLMG